MKIFCNGKIADSDSEVIRALDRGMIFGDGIYDVVKVVDGIFPFLEDHVKRLERSAIFFGMKLRYDLEEIKNVARELSVLNGVKNGELFLELTRGYDEIRDHIFGEKYEPTFLEIVQPLRKIDPILWKKGAKLVTFPDMRHGLCEHKTINLLPNVLAKNHAHSKGAYEALMFRMEDGKKYVTEGGSSSYIFFDGKRVVAPKIENILPSITRSKVLSIVKDMGVEVTERRVWLDEVWHMKEVILLSTVSKVMPVVQIDDTSFELGEMTKRLMEAFEDLILTQRTKIS